MDFKTQQFGFDCRDIKHERHQNNKEVLQLVEYHVISCMPIPSLIFNILFFYSTSHVQYDTATLICWSPDSKALLTVRALGNNIEIYKVTKKPEGGGLPAVQPSHTFPKV